MADEWEVATSGLLTGNMSVESWANQMDSIDAEHDWDGMSKL